MELQVRALDEQEWLSLYFDKEILGGMTNEEIIKMIRQIRADEALISRMDEELIEWQDDRLSNTITDP